MQNQNIGAKSERTAVPKHRQLPLCRLIVKVVAAKLQASQQKLSFADMLDAACVGLASHESAALKSILYLCERSRARSHAAAKYLMARQPKPQVQMLVETALSLLFGGTYTEFTVVNQAVEAARLDRRTERFAGLVNAVLRRAIREKTLLLNRIAEDPEVRFNAPRWWIERIRAAHPEHWTEILELAAQKPPLTLRVNRRRTTPEEYLEVLNRAGIAARRIGPEAILLESPRPVEEIPGFAMGLVSVQDAGTQMAAHLLAPNPGDAVLDACAAPGGKTAHLLELFDCSVTALEIDPKRTELLKATLARLGLFARVTCADAADPKSWWDGRQFDAVLLDAPCTASGIVRRQPDVPWTRRPDDSYSLAKTQAKLLKALWPTVKPNGKLLFCTCSIFPEEGIEQIRRFTSENADARCIPIGKSHVNMLTLLPCEESSTYDEAAAARDRFTFEPPVRDGFFYALLQKTA